MIRKLPIIGHPLTLRTVGYGALHGFDAECKDLFRQCLAEYSGAPYVFLLNSGIASFYSILEALKKVSSRNEVLLPCYTAPSLVVAIQKAGLKPVLCDISLTDFNADTDDALKRVNPNTLCIVGVHMFGIPWAGIVDLKEKAGDEVYIIEDCAQGFGAKIDDLPVGSFSDIAFYSFNRGKNLPTYDGGCIITHSHALASKLEEIVSFISSPSILQRASLALKLSALCFSFNPFFYSMLYPLIMHFKDNSVPPDFKVQRYSSFQAAVGYSLLKNAARAFSLRYENGKKLLRSLHGIPEIILPQIAKDIYPVFNRMPVIIKDQGNVMKIRQRLLRAGIESSKLYLRPLHHIFDLGYKQDDFPNAVYFAQRLLTLPVHPLVTQEDIEKIADVVKSCLAD